MYHTMILFSTALLLPSPSICRGQDSTALRRRALLELTSRLELERSRDRFSGDLTITVRGETARLDDPASGDIILFEPFYGVTEHGKAGYAIRVAANFDRWAFLRGTIEFLIDGQPARVEPAADPRRQVESPRVQELFMAWVPDSLFDRLAKAVFVEIRLAGTSRTIERPLPMLAIAQFWKLRDAKNLIVP